MNTNTFTAHRDSIISYFQEAGSAGLYSNSIHDFLNKSFAALIQSDEFGKMSAKAKARIFKEYDTVRNTLQLLHSFIMEHPLEDAAETKLKIA